MGPLLILGIIGLYFFRKRLIIFLPAFLALLLINIVRFSPEIFDSNKIGIYFVLFMAISASELFAFMLEKRRSLAIRTIFVVLAVLLFLTVTLGGILNRPQLQSPSGPRVYIASNIELRASGWIINNTPTNSRVLGQRPKLSDWINLESGVAYDGNGSQGYYMPSVGFEIYDPP